MFTKWIEKRKSSTLVLWTNSLEFMDLKIYSLFGWLVNKLFFQGWSPNTIKYFTFLNIYLVAPIACVCWSYIGDLYGRKPIILNTAMMMGVVSCLIIALPVEDYPYASAVALIGLRIVQGIALGGEPMAAYLFVMEEKKDIRDATFFIYLTRITEGIGALIALAFGSIIIWYFGEQYWRYFFATIAFFIGFAWFIRKHLHETEEYREHLSNEKIMIYERNKIKEIYKVREKIVQNYISGFLFWLSYPVMFTTCYFYLSPYVCKAMGWSDTSLIFYNFGVVSGELIFSFLLSYIILYFTKFDLKRVAIIVNTVGLIIAFFSLWHLEDLPLPLVFASQIAMMVFVNYGWVFPELFKSFSVIGRYTAMGSTWAAARFISFFTCTFVITELTERYGLGKGALILILVTNLIVFIGFFIMKPYLAIQKELRYGN